MASRKKALEFYEQGNIRRALQQAKGFKINVTEQERKIMTLGYECEVHPDFYRQTGTDIELAKSQALLVLKKVLGITPTITKEETKMVEKETYTEPEITVEEKTVDEERHTWLLLMGKRKSETRYLSIFESDDLNSVIKTKRAAGYTFIMSPSLAHVKKYLSGNEYGMRCVLAQLESRMNIEDVKSFFEKLVSTATLREFDLHNIEMDEEGNIVETGDEEEQLVA